MNSLCSLRFGVQTVPQHTTWPAIRDVWRLIDAAGYDTCWTFDHFYPIFSDPHGPCFEGWMLLAALAVETTRIELGTLVTGNTYRHPAVVANMAATLDHISNGRAILGIGAAWFDMEHTAYGIPFPPVGERIARLDESVTLIRKLLAQTETDFSGRYYTVKAAHCEPKPVRKPHLPIMIGGGGEKKTLRVVAKHADMWNWFGTIESFRHKLGVLEAHCDAVGRNRNEIEASWGGEMRITDGAGAKAKALAELANQRNQPEAEVEATCLIGSVEEIIARLRGYSEVGVKHFIICANPPYDLLGLRTFAEKIIPEFRSTS